MSFGWSAGDIASAIKLLVNIGKALKETFDDEAPHSGVISYLESLRTTLQYIEKHNGARIEPVQFEDLCEQCRCLKVSVMDFLDDAKRFEPALARKDVRSKILTAPRRLQWVCVMPGKIERLRREISGPILAINMALGFHTMYDTFYPLSISVD